MNANAVAIAWVEFIKAQSEGITDIRSMERALTAAEKYMLADERAASAKVLARSEANAQMWFDIAERRGKALRQRTVE